MKKMAMILVSVMALSLAGCGGSSDKSAISDQSRTEAKADREADAAVIALNGDPTTFAPNGNFADFTHWVTDQIYGKLLKRDGKGGYEYICAEGVEQEDDTHILIKLRQGITDTKGNELTASDVLFDLANISNSVYSSMYTNIDIEGSEILDDYTLRLAQYKPFSFQIALLEAVQLYDEDSYKESEDGMLLSPVGYGAYYLDSYVAGAECVVKAREDYWGGELELKTVTFQTITDDTQRKNALIAGDVDFAEGISYSDVDSINQNKGTSIFQKEGFASNGIIFNMDQVSAASDIHLRRAIAYAIDTASLISVSYNNLATEPISMFSTGCTDYEEETWKEIAGEYGDYYAYNLEKAKEELEQSQYPEGLTIQAVHYTTNGGDKNSQLVQAMLESVGIHVEITAFDGATFNDMLVNEPEKWDIAFAGWYAGVPYSAEIAALQIVGSNFCNWTGDEFDLFADAVARAESATSDEDILAACNDVVKISTEYLPFYSLADVHQPIGTSDRVNIVFATDYIDLAASGCVRS